MAYVAWNQLPKISLYTVLLLLLSPTVIDAQEPEVIEATTTISPRVGVDFNTPRHGDDERSFGRVTGFIPLWQTPGNGLTFLDTAIRLNSTGDLGGTVSVGQRFLQGDLVLGGHLSYDIRDTGNNTFNQLGLGIEAFGDKWDVHLNGYLPVGDTQQSAGSTGGTDQVTDTQFQGNQLVFITAGGGSEFLESAWGGVDLDAGMQLADWADWGQLWGYGGIYYHGDAIGGRLRVDHRVQDWMRLGLGVQSDDNFGTRGFFSIGFSWGGGSGSDATDESVSLWARAAESVTRNSSIIVKESEVVTATAGTQVAVNPTTGQAYNFQHVTPDSTSTAGDGTIENPAANVSLVNAQTGDIIYVREGDSRTNPLASFTVPAGVVAISDANLETIATQSGTVTLPGSGTGILPLVDAMGSDVGITLVGGNNRLSGFEITGASDANILVDSSNNALIENNFSRDDLDDGIEVTNSSNVILTNNIFSNSGDDAIDLENSANAVISNNTISGSTVDGIDILNSAGLIINNNTIIDSGGIGIALEESSDAVIQSNTITNSVEAGIGLFASANAAVEDNSIDGGDFGILAVESDNAVIQNNVVSNTVLSGIEVVDSNDVTVADNTINNNGELGIFIDASDSTLVQNNQITESILGGVDLRFATNARVIGNTISDSGSGAIFVFDSETITIQDNQVTNTATDITADDIVGAIFLQEVVGTVDISGNTVTGTTGTNEFDGQGIAIGNSTGDIVLTIDDNDVNNNQGDGIGIALIDLFTPAPGDATAEITITNNRVENNGVAAPLRGDGIRIAVEEDGVINSLLIENNTLTGNFDDGIDISAGLAQLATIIVPNPNISSSNAQILNAVIRNNEITDSLNGQGIVLRSVGDNSNVVISVEDNILANNTLGGLEATSTDTNGAPETRLCLALNNNTSDGDYTLIETLPLLVITSSNFTVVNRDGVAGANTGPVIFSPIIGDFDTVANIAACP
ncbi:parallel beta-helix repeat (two copies) [Leptolyngbya sp. Heron Island J]|uniref:inverse autotransporter beta-barrel domain-containing protein n=1 Tax=Leptolyngbya sp. Heron Island J TaxID=1385935 RepID=UPI0003B9CD04|nr:inverse autotransporter beta-barrel domain-containing protein [Leptolyngbya sp. Heron Island J]ESA34062.1 parallel beta-helix repeat (two copies) [Leptolyngbya sp. Heron Island J]